MAVLVRVGGRHRPHHGRTGCETVVEPVIEEEVPVQEPPAETGWLSYATGGSDAPASAAEPAASTAEEVDVAQEETLTYAEGTDVWDDE